MAGRPLPTEQKVRLELRAPQLGALAQARPARRDEPPYGGGTNERPGLHVSCLSFLRDHDVSVLVWDMIDHLPSWRRLASGPF